MITFEQSGSFDHTESYLKGLLRRNYFNGIEKYAQEGQAALEAATPIDSGKTRDSWDYELKQSRDSLVITWTNSNINEGVSVAVLIQYGHGTGTGGYVQGLDYINPAMKPVFEQIAQKVWKEVTKA